MQKVCVLLLSAVACLLLARMTWARRVDCTKFVFAPRCRGISAKRNMEAVMPEASLDRGSDQLAIENEDYQYPRKKDSLTGDKLDVFRVPLPSVFQENGIPARTLDDLIRMAYRLRKERRGYSNAGENMQDIASPDEKQVQIPESFLSHLQRTELEDVE